MADRDWVDWHRAYEEPGSLLFRRLGLVQQRIRDALDGFPPGPIRAVSMCAGQGRDLLGVLADHPRRGDVSARLVELDPRNAEVAAQTARAVGLSGIDVVVADAGLTDSYLGAVPAELVLACGVFGNITDEDIERTVSYFPRMCAPGATVVWTRHRRPADLVPSLCGWLAGRGFTQLWVSDPVEEFGVGAHRYTGTPELLPAGDRIFTFVGHEALEQR